MAKQSYRKLKGKVARKTITTSELREYNKLERYRRRAKSLRNTHAFGDLFSGTENNLLYPEKWTPAQKARVTRYAKELGPLLASPIKTKRYFRPDHLASAIEVSSQENRLPGQKAAIFIVDDPDQKVVIEFDSKHRIKKVVRAGIEESKSEWDMDAFAADPVGVLTEYLEAAPGKFHKFMTGINESSRTRNASEMIAEMERIIIEYDPDEIDYENFMYGIISYPNITNQKVLAKRDREHQLVVKARERGRLRKLSAGKRAMTKAEQRSIKTTGRAGRVK